MSLVGGRPCLDFANTVGSAEGELRGQERLETYADLVEWCARVELFGRTEAARLLDEATRRPEDAGRVLESARRLREAIYRTFSAVVHDGEPEAADVEILNGVLAEGMARRRLRPGEFGFCWSWAEAPDDLDWVLWPIAYSAAELLTSTDLERVKECGSDACTWLFLDLSRNHSRRWCDMSDCGNRAKARRHYQRQRASQQ